MYEKMGFIKNRGIVKVHSRPDFCKNCQRTKIIHRRWRDDFFCGYCGLEYKVQVD